MMPRDFWNHGICPITGFKLTKFGRAWENLPKKERKLAKWPANNHLEKEMERL